MGGMGGIGGAGGAGGAGGTGGGRVEGKPAVCSTVTFCSMVTLTVTLSDANDGAVRNGSEEKANNAAVRIGIAFLMLMYLSF